MNAGTNPASATAPTSVASPKPQETPAKAPRIASVDAFRGIVMTLMLGEVLNLPAMARIFSQSAFWGFIAFHNEHVQWQGCSLHDLIQPGFSFLVGISLPFSIASRKAKGQGFRQLFGHAVWRALILVFLGIFLRSFGHRQTYFTFEDTLTQIGLGYALLFLLAWTRVRTQVIALVLILVGYWALFAFYPAPGPQFDYTQVGVPAHWSELYTGFQSHWNMNSNAAWAFDKWFLNLLPREQPFRFNSGGYSTLSFIPTLGTMILGLLAGEFLKRGGSQLVKLRGLAGAGAALVVLALCIQWAGICPIVKKIWTPSWTLYSGGLVLLILAGLYALMEWKGWKSWAFPFMVVGMNSIAIYFMSWTIKGFVDGALVRHLGTAPFLVFGPNFGQVLRGAAVMLVLWLILFWMYRRKIFLRI
jgi:heparan-alpha-glucosaminide N-acetyltransferase